MEPGEQGKEKDVGNEGRLRVEVNIKGVGGAGGRRRGEVTEGRRGRRRGGRGRGEGGESDEYITEEDERNTLKRRRVKEVKDERKNAFEVPLELILQGEQLSFVNRAGKDGEDRIGEEAIKQMEGGLDDLEEGGITHPQNGDKAPVYLQENGILAFLDQRGDENREAMDQFDDNTAAGGDDEGEVGDIVVVHEIHHGGCVLNVFLEEMLIFIDHGKQTDYYLIGFVFLQFSYLNDVFLEVSVDFYPQ